MSKVLKRRMVVQSILLLIWISFYLLPVPAQAYSGGDGSAGNPYQINTIADLEQVRADAINNTTTGKYYKLMNDIDLAGIANWGPIGVYPDHPFSGNFNGNNHIISHVTIGTSGSPDASLDTVGLFGITNEATISNLSVTDAALYSSKPIALVAILAAGFVGGSMENCYASGTLVGGQDSYTGNLVGGNSGIISNCHATGSVISGQDIRSPYHNEHLYAGGLVGYNDHGIIEQSYATGSVKAGWNSHNYHVYSGGLVGYNTDSLIKNSYATGIVTGYSALNGADVDFNAGGLAGENDSSSSITGCYATGRVTFSGPNLMCYGGGLVGENRWGSIVDSYAAGGVSGSYVKRGGLIGRYWGGAISRGFWNSDTVSPKQGIGKIESGTDATTGKTTIEMQDLNFMATLNRHGRENACWKFISGKNDGYPVLVNVGDGVDRSSYTDWYYSDPGAASFTISSAAEFAYFSELVNTGTAFSGKTINLNADIDLSTDINSREWWPIGYTNSFFFQGTFNSNGHSITNLTIGATDDADSSLDYLGLFGYCNGIELNNLAVLDITIYSSRNYAYIGGLAGYVDGCTIRDSHTQISAIIGGDIACIGGLAGNNNLTLIENCYTAGYLEGGNDYTRIGGLAGTNTGTLIHCRSTCSIFCGDSDWAGGLVGENTGLITHCYSTGSVEAGSVVNDIAFIGGLVGINYKGIIKNSYANPTTGSVTGGQEVYAGGLVGYNSSNAIIANCYARSNVHCDISTYVGGLAGQNNIASITNCYATGDVTGWTSSWVGGLAGRLLGGDLIYGYWNSNATQQIGDDPQVPKKGVGRGTDTSTSKTSAEMKTEAFVALLNANRGNNSPWLIVSGQNDGYPILGYFVTFNSNGGSAVDGAIADYGATIAEPAPPTKSNSDFSGWYKDEGLTTAWNFAVDTVTSDITLHAKWTSTFPEATTEAATAISTTSATLNMSYDFKTYTSGQVQFAYKKAADPGWTYTTWTARSGSGPCENAVFLLSTDTMYQFKARLKYDSTETDGNTLSFTTGKATPVVTTMAATVVSKDAATINMSYTMGDYTPVYVRFAYRKAGNATWTYNPWVSKITAGTHSVPLTALETRTQYEFRGEIRYGSNTVPGGTLQFSTVMIAPTVTTLAAGNIGETKATLNMHFTMGDYSTVEVRFAYKKHALTSWTNTSWTTVTATGTHPENLINLETDQRYDFRGEVKYNSIILYGNTLQFTTRKPLIGTGTNTGGSSSISAPTPVPPQAPTPLPNIQVQSAMLSNESANPGAPVTVTAAISNRGQADGTSVIKVYVNGEVESVQGVTVDSGKSKQISFTICRNEPGNYTVHVNSTPAGSFTVNGYDPDIILFTSMGMILVSLVLGCFYVWRTRQDNY